MIKKTEQPLVSLIMANYNNADYIVEALESARNQTYKNIEVILVDDVSADNSIEVINRYMNDHPEFSIVFHKNEINLGCGGTKHKCMELAKGEIFASLDSDDIIVPETVELMVNEHLNHPECSIIYSTLYECNEKLEPQRISAWAGEIPKGETHLTSTGGHISAFATCKRSFYDKTAGEDPKYIIGDDQDMYMKMEEVGAVLFFNKPLYYYRKHGNNLSWNDKSRILNAYWLLTAHEEAYIRRKKMKNQIPNLSFAEIQRKKLLYNLLLFESDFANRDYFKSLWHLLKSLVYVYVDKDFFILKKIRNTLRK